MQILIEIPKEYYEALQEISDDNCIADMLIIKHGTPLPEGHGRLIDADTMWDNYHSNDYDFYEALDDAPTIIEADTESENKE